ncbi:MAG: alpha/beta hydrolase [Planctomycetes bacterium]|nr:alpha/beta hydrolase [Planctomycetota bacterium]
MSEVPEPRRRWLLRRVRRWAVLLLVTYLVIVAVFWFLERRLVFRPSSAEEAWLKPADARTQDVWFYAADGSKIFGRWIPPESPQHGAVLITYGNGGNLTHRGKLAADLRKALGAGVLLFDYPGYGKSSGSPTEEGCYAAGDAAYQWLTAEQKIAPNRIILCGESLGGGTAVELATRHEHRALVLIYTFTSLPAAAKYHYPFLPTHALMRTRFDNLSKIARCPRPVFFLHGTADRVVPFSHSEQLYAAANEPKHFVRLNGFGHSELVGDVFTTELVKFLNEHAP